MAKGKKGNGDKKVKNAKESKEAREAAKAKKAAEDKLELDIIYRTIHFYTNKETTHEQRLQVRDALKGIIPDMPDDPKPDDTGGEAA